MKRKLFTIVTLIVVTANIGSLKAQVTIGSNDAPNKDAVLDLISNDTKGLLLPRVALTSTTVAAPVGTTFTPGMAVYNTNTAGDVTPGYYFSDDYHWVRLADAATYVEPWNVAKTTNKATSNTQDIYQTGKVGINTSLPGSTLTVKGSFAGQYRTISASTTIDSTDFYVAYNSATAGTITLPAATAATPVAGNILGRIYHIKNTGTATLTVKASGSELIDWNGTAGVASVTVPPGGYAMLVSKGTTTGTTWEFALLYNPAVTTIACVSAGKTTAGVEDPVYYTGTDLADFNNYIPQVIPFRTTAYPLNLVINQGGSAVWNDTGSYWDIKESGVYKLEAYAYFGSKDFVTPYTSVYYSSTTPSFTATGAAKLYTNPFVGINLNITKNGTANANIIGGARANIDNEAAKFGNSLISTSCIVRLAAGDKIYLTMNLGVGSNAVGDAHISTPNNLKQNRYFSLQQLSTP